MSQDNHGVGGPHGDDSNQCSRVSGLSNEKWINEIPEDANDDAVITVVYSW